MIRRYFTPEVSLAYMLIVAAILIGHYFRTTYEQLYTAPYFVVLVIIGNMAGYRASMLAAIAFSIGAWLHWYDTQPTRLGWNIASLLLVAHIIGSLKRKARIVDVLNGNIDELWGMVFTSEWLMRHWKSMPDNVKFERVKELKDRSTNLTTRVMGWRKLAELRREVENVYTDSDKTNTDTQEL